MKKFFAIGVFVVALGALIGWRMMAKKAATDELNKTQQARRGGATNVQLATAVSRDIVQSLETVGSVESPYNVKLSPKVAGRIDYLEVREGTAVKPGQILVKIDPTEVEGQVLQQQAAVAEARSRLAQAQLTQ